MNKLKCKLCNYESKQLFQHLKSKHSMNTIEYRQLFGINEVVQIGFLPDNKIKNDYNSKYVKNGYKKINDKVNDVVDLYSKKAVRNILNKENLWKRYIGKTKYRTMINDDIVLYKSICEYSKEAELIISKKMTLPEKMRFITEYNYDVHKIKCNCGKTYTWNKYCRYCPIDRSNMANRKHSTETKKKQRLSTIEYIKTMNGQLAPRYNVKSIPIIEQYGKQNGYNFQHAENGGEYHIKELGYFVDGYDKKKNVVLEIDDKHHYNVDGTLKEKDIQRQKEIEEHLGCKFIRIAYDT